MSDSDLWHFDTDPHEIVPLGFKSTRNRYEVIGFCTPAGDSLINTMVQIKYFNSGRTTRCYLHVLQDFMTEDPEGFRECFNKARYGVK